MQKVLALVISLLVASVFIVGCQKRTRNYATTPPPAGTPAYTVVPQQVDSK